MRYLTALLLLVLCAISVAAKDPITIYLAGDSTMAQKLPEKRPETGWGEALQKAFQDGSVRVENHAQNGRSTRTFISEGRWQAIIDKLRKGDYVFIQFGHNDESQEKVDRYTPPADYRRNLIKFINEVREKKATPVLLTPVMRRRFDDKGNFFDTHGEYPDIVRQVAVEKHVELIDMHRSSERVLRYYGPEATKKFFLQLPPNENSNYPKGIEDNTHFSPAGADVMADLVVAAIRTQKLGLARYLKDQSVAAALKQVMWQVNSNDKIGGLPVTRIGEPEIVAGPNGKSVQFDGVDDGLAVQSNPIAGATAFTVEAIFRPDAGGTFEQRWFHLQESATDSRVMLEIRLTGEQWFLDTFIKSGEEKRTLFSENFKHKTGEWYHIALVYDGVTMRDFVNGKEEMSGPLAILPLRSGSASIGVRMNRVFWFKGAISKARFTPRALSPNEFMTNPSGRAGASRPSRPGGF
ncbi:MAG TPA: LamG-like jellyroll fold domain-containing protein [Pyrinomonadaceae bacterium]|nr:LamG-like jellyroll fold domain-containing protein [Pyrinomonadaceae bacterium]